MIDKYVSPPPCGAIVGAGNVGQVLHRLAPTLQVVRRTDNLSEMLKGLPPTCPIYVATTNDALTSVIVHTPAPRLGDLVFLQNGMLQPLLWQHRLAYNAQAQLYLSARPDGSYTDGKRTVVCGRWAGSFCALLRAGGLQCRAVTRDEYLPLMVEKLLWASIFWLLSDALGGLPVGQVAAQHKDAVKGLVSELLPIAQHALLTAQQQQQQQQQKGQQQQQQQQQKGQQQQQDECNAAVTAEPQHGAGAAPTAPLAQLNFQGVTQGLLDYSLSIPTAVPSRQMALAEFEWRNGWFLREQRTPLHVEWLRRAGLVGR